MNLPRRQVSIASTSVWKPAEGPDIRTAFSDALMTARESLSQEQRVWLDDHLAECTSDVRPLTGHCKEFNTYSDKV